MHESFFAYSVRIFTDVTNAIINLMLFLPYYFSVQRLLRTLLAPWKLTGVKDISKMNIAQFSSYIGENFSSRLVGFMVRTSILIAYIFIQAGFMLSIPFIYVVATGIIPVRYIFYLLTPSETEKKKELFQQFAMRHLADQSKHQKVVEWFDMYYTAFVQKPWWSMERLLKNPPIGRDLTFGYTPTLDAFSTDLTVQQPHQPHLIGRKAEIEHIQSILIKETSPNVLLSGDIGTGKHAIVEALSQAIYHGGVHKKLAYKRVLHMDIEKILATAHDFIAREAIIAKIFEEAVAAQNIIIYIPQIERYVDSLNGHIDLSHVIARFATSKHIQFIATTTPSMFQTYIYPSKSIAGVFEKIDIPEVTPEQTKLILMDVSPLKELEYSIPITYDALEEIVRLSEAFSSTTPQPEASLKLLDQAFSYVQAHPETQAINGHIIRSIIEQKTHIPTELTPQLTEKIRNLESQLKQRVLFQDEAIHTLTSSIRKAWLSLSQRHKPLATVLFLGPTGVGKTETAKAVTDAFFGSQTSLLRFDMATYQSQDDIDKLIGSLETHDPGELTEAVRKQPYGTLLLDELEKAHPKLLNIFLPLLDEGYFVDGSGERVDCTHLIVIATSNAGADFIYERMTSGSQTQTPSQPLIDHLISTRIFAPEFLNRFDGIVVFKPLLKADMIVIAQRMLQSISKSMFDQHKATVSFSPQFTANLVETHYDPRFGARNLQRIIQNSVEDVLAQKILDGSLAGSSIQF